METSRAVRVNSGNDRDDLRPTLFGMRRSCSECGRRKKRCDGQRPCGRCVSKGSQCTYIKRRWHLHSPHQDQRQPQRPDHDGAHGEQALVRSTPPCALASSGRLPLKRFRWSASPATGLVGMQENAFLSDFFDGVGFLPLTNKSHIRETMVKIMTSYADLQQPTVRTDCDDEGPFDAIARGADWSKASECNQLPMDPSTCTFWCAIALGALAKGSPVESVSKYFELAQEALAKSYSGPADLEVAKAWAILAYLCGFMGDVVQFQEYLALSDSFLTISIEQGSADTLPVGFAEIVKHKDIANSSCGRWQMKSFSAQEQATPQLNKAATEVELYQYVAQSLRAFEQAVHTQAIIQSATACEHLCEVVSDGRSDTVLRSDHVLLPREVAEAMGTVLGTENCLNFEPLEEAVDRPSVRGGIGSLLINATLVFKKAAKGDLHAALERIRRSVDVFERFPGLCRSMMGCHLAHMMLLSLAAIGGCRAQAMYDRLRGFYNSFRPSGSRPVPPLEEWHGVDVFCDDLYCKAIDLIASRLQAFSAPPVDNIKVCVETKGGDMDNGETVLHGHLETQSDALSPCVIPGKVLGTAVPDWPMEGGAPCCMGSKLALTAPIASPGSSHHPWCCCKEELNSDRVANSVSLVIAPGPFSRFPEMSERVRVVDDAEEESIDIENWLDVTHAMLDTL